jgi:hypothetical protein
VPERSDVAWDSVAVLVTWPREAEFETSTVIVAVAEAPFARPPTAQVTVPAANEMVPVAVEELT